MYETVVRLATVHLDQIILDIVKLIKNSNIPFYSQLDSAELVKRIGPTIPLRLRYLESGDLTEWREWCDYITSLRAG
jgi:hypothetical protein